MSAALTGRRKPTKPKKQARIQKRKRDDVDVEKLQRGVDELDTTGPFTKFADLPLSEPTKAGLKQCHFSGLTDIQAKAIALGLKGADILGAAKTGSGKTLAFLIPVLENLYRSQCIGMDAGLGAMIVSPTRELAIQIFDVLCKIGKCGHLFAAGLVIGGKSLQEEQHALARMNIVVCTPGRILQHLSQTAAFNIDNLQMLVLDEADRIMDMGFQHDVDAIIDYLPPSRQTLLFSATQTKKVSDLGRLSLKEPEYVSVHEAATSATPKTLQQNYVVTPLPSKLDTLWSFIQSSKKSKLLIFLSSGKQVRYVYEAFRKMQPGMSLLHLHGRQKQTARLDITGRFAASKHACLFATDVVARGLDFPAVDWVVQVDCPEDADTYIHRVGRTARYERDGRAVLFLDPSEEEGMLSRLAAKKVPLERINIRAKKQQSIRNQLQAMCFKDPELKYLGQKAFTSYVKSIHVQKDKEVFAIDNYELEDFAASLGLPGAPRIKFMRGDADAQKRLKNASRQAVEVSGSEDEGEDAETSGTKKVDDKKPRTRYDRMFERRNQDVLSTHYSRLKAEEKAEHEDEEPDSDPSDREHDFSGLNGKTNGVSTNADNNDKTNTHDDDLFTIKRRIPPPSQDSVDPTSNPPNTTNSNTTAHGPFSSTLKPTSTRQLTLLKSRAKAAKLLASQKDPRAIAKHIQFTDDGGTRDASRAVLDDETVLGDEVKRQEQRKMFLEEQRREMGGRDEVDRAVEKQRRREKRERVMKKEREREKEEREGSGDSDGGGGGVRLEVIERPFEELADLYEDVGDDGRGAAGDGGADADAGRGDAHSGSKYGEREGDDALDDAVDDADIRGEAHPRKKRRRSSATSPDTALDDGAGSEKKAKKKDKKKKSTQPQSLEDLEAMASGLLA